MLTMVIIAAAFVGVATLVGGVFLLFKGGRDSVLDERLKRLAGVAEQVSKKTEPSLLASPLGESSHPLKGRLLRISQLSNLCEQADLPLSQTAFLFISIASGTGPAVLCVVCLGGRLHYLACRALFCLGAGCSCAADVVYRLSLGSCPMPWN